MDTGFLAGTTCGVMLALVGASCGGGLGAQADAGIAVDAAPDVDAARAARELCVATTLGYPSQDRGARIAVLDATAVEWQPLRLIEPHTPLVETLDWANVAISELHDEIFVLGRNFVVVYARNANGNVAPLRTLLLNPTWRAGGLAFDPVHDELSVMMLTDGNGGDTSSVVLFYPRTASGDAAPVRTLRKLVSTVAYWRAIASDPANGELWAASSDGALEVFPWLASGDAPPVRRITGTGARLDRTVAIAVDDAHNEVSFVVGPKTVNVYRRMDSGAVAPIRVITDIGGSSDQTSLTSLSADPAHDELLIAVDQSGQDGGSLVVLARLGTGPAQPLRMITGGLHPVSAQFDNTHGEILALNRERASMSAYPRLASGATPPSRTIEAIGLAGNSTAMMADLTHREIVVADRQGSIVFLPILETGAVAPRRVISKPRRWGLSQDTFTPLGIDLARDELWTVAWSGLSASLEVYPRSGNGELQPSRSYTLPNSPVLGWADEEILAVEQSTLAVYARPEGADSLTLLRRIAGPATGLQRTYPVLLDARRGEIVVINSRVEQGMKTQWVYHQVAGYALRAEGDTAPLWKFEVPRGEPMESMPPRPMIAIDPDVDEIFVSDRRSIRVYSRAGAQLRSITAPLGAEVRELARCN